jgi:hypothetical protein
MLTVLMEVLPGLAALLLLCQAPTGMRRTRMNEPLHLSAAFKLQRDHLVLDYQVSNLAARDVYLLNRLYRTTPRWDMSPDLVYIDLDPATETVWLSKRIADLPSGVSVNAPVSPFVTPLRAGGVFREQVHVRLPVREYHQYSPGHSHEGPPGARRFKRAYFTLGYYWRPEGAVEETRDIQGTPVIFPRTPPGKPIEFGQARTDVMHLDIPVLIE